MPDLSSVRASFVFLLAVLPTVLAGCVWGEAPEPSPTPVPVARVAPTVPAGTFTPPPTATPWPTFTPVPSPTPVPVPTRILESVLLEPVALPAPSPTAPAGSEPDLRATAEAGGSVLRDADPLPTPAVTAGVVRATPVSAPTAVPRPGPTPYGLLEISENGQEGEARLLHQTLFPLQTAALPESFLTGAPEDLPDGVDFISRNSRFVLWVVLYDVSGAPEGWEMNGYVRWLNVNRGFEPLLMLEREVRLSHEVFSIYQGLGTESPGFWRPGQYRVEFLDGDYEEVVSWDFEVR